MVTLEWFKEMQHEGHCIACDALRNKRNNVFCEEHYHLFMDSRQFRDLGRAYKVHDGLDHLDIKKRQRARLEAWLSFANEHKTYHCFCGNERDYFDYLCPSCRESYATAA